MTQVKSFKKISLAALALVLGGTVLVTSCGRGRFFSHSPAERADFIAEHITDELDLDSAQQAKLESIKKEVVAKMEAMHTNRESKKSRVLTLVRSNNLSAADVNAVIAEHEAQREQMKPFMVEKIVEFHAMLTPEQRNTLAEKMEEFHGRMPR